MSGRRKPPAPMRRVDTPEYSKTVHQSAIANVPPNPANLNYDTFQRFSSLIKAHYVFGSAERIQELETLWSRQNLANAPITNKHFADMLCHWTLYYKSDLVRFRNNVIAFINAGSRLNNLGLRVDTSTHHS
jgi:hypothetical protein